MGGLRKVVANSSLWNCEITFYLPANGRGGGEDALWVWIPPTEAMTGQVIFRTLKESLPFMSG